MSEPIDRDLLDVVVLGKKRYKNWHCVYAGCGVLEWRNGGDRFVMTAEPYMRPDWLKWCWEESKALIDRKLVPTSSVPAPTDH